MDESLKYKQAYINILEDLAIKKKKLNQEHQGSINKVQEMKGQLVSEWKKNSNEEIHKRCIAKNM